ncbi:DMT family transporter [Actinoplanes sp. NPDC051494]|uniref:DMT family transporter n=1 Tax=Actinoplanes sp. NPDC051494 TaxID=3363907 RepID=UPI00378B5882
MGIVVAVLLCVVSSAAYAAAAVVQENVAHRPLRALLHLPAWWSAIALNAVGAVLHVGALASGPLSLVQPFGVLTLVMAVPVAAVVARRAVTRIEWHGIAMTVLGLGGILVLAGSAGPGALTASQLVGLLLVTAIVLVVIGGSGASGLWAALAGGIAFGVSSALTQTVVVHLSAGLGFVTVLTGAAIGVLSCAGLLFAQRSYRDGLGAPLAVGTLANPVAAAVIGMVLLGERITGGPLGLVIAGCSALTAALGVALLTRARSPLSTTSPSVRI